MFANSERIKEFAVKKLKETGLDSISDENIALPNSVFQPEGKRLWIRVSVNLSDDAGYTEYSARRSGIIDYHVCVPQNTGTARVNNVASKIASLFSVRKGINGCFVLPSGYRLIVRSVGQTKGVSPDCFSVIVSIAFDMYMEDK